MNRSVRTRDIVGEMIGLSGVKITKLLLIEKENEDFIELIDKGILKIHQAYIQLSRNKKEIPGLITGKIILIQTIRILDFLISVPLKWKN